MPRFSKDNLAANYALVDHVTALADAKDATPAQVALAWLLAKDPHLAPIPGTRRRERVDENAAAARLPLSADDVADLDGLADRIGVAGDRYHPTHMSMVGL
ncbi:hypothetical protein GCM10025876_05520 [Demequina litorisediminis]|uniref:NADP-dependent oxidoreductase domain-containing protein n=1 Tax=Demequina litorisediminis TaxID=1849022 RepID=A0ABQ6IB73_9MICO|nr:hypothetical protein GCM10025876_05520 [Demequina litorisediminis]